MVRVIKNNKACLTTKVYGKVAGLIEFATNYKKVVNSSITTVGCRDPIFTVVTPAVVPVIEIEL